MSSPKDSVHAISGRAEASFRKAFDRLKIGKPDLLIKGSKVTQNNVAKEAGRDPSALKKSRFPGLVSDIQRWIEAHAGEALKSPRQMMLTQRSRNQILKARIVELEVQRDRNASLLLEADMKILDLTVENARLNALLPESNVTPLTRRQ